MKSRKTITKLFTATLAMTALAATLLSGAGWLQPVAAQTGDESVTFTTYASVGIVPGELIRLSMANPKESKGTLMLTYSFYLAHGSISSYTAPLYESELIKIPASEYRYVNVRRMSLNTEGELTTGRAQLIVKTTIIAPAGSSPDDFPGSLEVLPDEVQSGNAAQIDSKYRLIILAAKRSKPMLAPISLDPDEKLRYTIFNPNEEGSETVRVGTYTYDGLGRLTSQSPPAVLRPGESCTFEVNYDDLKVAADATGRVQVGSGIQVLMMDGSVRTVKLSVWRELVSTRTGSTNGGDGGDYYTGTVSVSGDGF